MPYEGVKGETLIKPFKLENIYHTKKLSYYCHKKDKVPEYLKYHIAVQHVIMNIFGKQIKILTLAFRNIVAQIKSHCFKITC